MNKLKQLFGKDVLRDFWVWFRKYEKNFFEFEKDQDRLFTAITKKLKQIHPSLTFEFSPVHADGSRELTISADGIKDAFPYVVQLVDRAPVIPRWKINAFRQRIPSDDLAVQIGEDVKVGYADIFFSHGLHDGHIDLELYIRNYQDSDPFKSAVFILLDALIGEYDMEMKIGRLEFNRLDGQQSRKLIPILQLRSLVDAQVPY